MWNPAGGELIQVRGWSVAIVGMLPFRRYVAAASARWSVRMSQTNAAIWWIELIKISPGLITVLFCIVLVILNRRTLTAMLERMTKFKGLGLEAEFATKELD